MNIETLNTVVDTTFEELLLRCCGAKRWVEKMKNLRPFASEKDLLDKAVAAAGALQREDWLEAFSHHPKIGDVESLRKKFATQNWASKEQSGVSGADEATLLELSRGNALYEEKFGYIFIICATGKSAKQMAKALAARLKHSPQEELLIASQEQNKITQIRLKKLLSET